MSTEAGCAGSRGSFENGVARGLLLLIDAYRLGLAPLLGGHCRYEPSCSHYAREAIERHGPRRGLALAMSRLLRCHPFRPGGADPVP